MRHYEACVIPDELREVFYWLGGKVCITGGCPILKLLMSTLPVILITDFSFGRHCTTLVLSSPDTWLVKPLVTPTVQKVFVINDSPITGVRLSNLEGRRTLIASCNRSDFFVKSEFESNIRHVASGLLNESLPGDKISKDRTVLLGTFNCTIFSATGPIINGKPEWIDGVELLGVTAVLESHGLKWSIVPTTGFGEAYPDGRLEEGKLKSLLAKGYVDIGFCDYWHNSGVISDVLNPWHRTCTRLLVPKPRNVYTYWHSIFKPLPPQFWVSVILCTLISSCVISVLSSFTWEERANKRARTTFGDSCFEAVSLLIQGFGNLRANRGVRVIQASWALFGVIAWSAYSSSLASILTTPIQEEVPQTLVELIKHGYVWISGIEPLTNPEYVFKTESGVDEKWIKRQVNDIGQVKGRTTVLGEELGDIFIMSEAPSFRKTFLQNLMVSSECLAANHISIMTRKMSSYFEFMSDGFSRLAETGVLTKILLDGLKSPHINKYVVKTGSPQVEQKLGGVPLGLAPLRGAFYILIFGQLLAFAAFLLELRYFSLKFSTRKKIKSQKNLMYLD